MKHFLVCILIFLSLTAQGQYQNKAVVEALSTMASLRDIPPTLYLKTSSPVLSISNGDRPFLYWQGMSHSRLSRNGRFQSFYAFDLKGNLIESRASYKLQRRGLLSAWRVQFSNQRSRPLFIYTIR